MVWDRERYCEGDMRGVVKPWAWRLKALPPIFVRMGKVAGRGRGWFWVVVAGWGGEVVVCESWIGRFV